MVRVKGKVHVLKTWPEYFQQSWLGRKPFEVRLNDRDYKVGDVLKLREYDPATGQYSGREVIRRVLSLLTHEQAGIQPGFVVMGLSKNRNGTWGARYLVREFEKEQANANS